MSARNDAPDGTVVPELIDRPPVAGGLQLSLSPDLAARVKAAAAQRGETARRLVLDVIDIVFAVGTHSLVDAVLDREPE